MEYRLMLVWPPFSLDEEETLYSFLHSFGSIDIHNFNEVILQTESFDLIPSKYPNIQIIICGDTWFYDISEFMDQLNERVMNKTQKPTSSWAPDFSQIPLSAIKRLAERFQLGEKKHGKDNWKKGLNDTDYVVERINHIIYHALKLQGKLTNNIEWDKDDDVGAILWGGALISEAMIALGHQDKIDPMFEG